MNAAKTLLVSHLRAVDFAAHMKALSPDEKALLSEGLGKIGPEGVDWQSTVRREFEVLARSGSPVPAAVEELFRRALQDAGHELRTPLTSIRGYAELLREEGLPVEQREWVDVIDRNSARLASLVEDLLLMAQIQSGALPLELSEVPDDQ